MEAYVLKLLYFIFAIIITTRSRKYDIEYEAIKLYGRNVSGILDRFRKSSDYVNILKDKVQELDSEFTDIYFQTTTYCGKQLKKKIKEILGINVTAIITLLSTSTTASSPTVARHGVRQGLNGTVIVQKKIDRIDTYPKLTSALTFKERIKFKDLGFKTAGDCIRTMRESMLEDGETSGKHVNKINQVQEGKKPDATTYKVYANDEEKAKTTNEGARINVWHSDSDKTNTTSTFKIYANTAAPRSVL